MPNKEVPTGKNEELDRFFFYFIHSFGCLAPPSAIKKGRWESMEGTNKTLRRERSEDNGPRLQPVRSDFLLGLCIEQREAPDGILELLN